MWGINPILSCSRLNTKVGSYALPDQFWLLVLNLQPLAVSGLFLEKIKAWHIIKKFLIDQPSADLSFYKNVENNLGTKTVKTYFMISLIQKCNHIELG